MLQKLRENYEKKAVNERSHLEELKKEIEEVKEKIEEQRLILRKNQDLKIEQPHLSQSITSGTEDHKTDRKKMKIFTSVNQQIKQLEHTLDRQLQKYNEAVANNRKFRSYIDDLRKERNVYKKINKKLKEELKIKKTDLEKELKEAEEIYIRKEMIRKKLSELKVETEKQDTDYQEELRKLRKLIDQDRKKGIFEDESNKPSTSTKQEEPKKRGILQTAQKDQNKSPVKGKRGASVNFYPTGKTPEKAALNIRESSLMSPPSSTLVKNQRLSNSKMFSTLGSSGNHSLTHHGKFGDHYEKKETLQTSLKQVEQYETAFKQIKEASGKQNLDELVNMFVKWETKIFSRFSFINDMIAENDKLDEEINNVEKEIEKYNKIMEEEEKAKASNVQRYKEKIAGESLSAQPQKNVPLRQKYKEVFEDQDEENDFLQTLRVMNALKVGIQNIFDNIGCANEHTQELVGTHGVTESNMMQYLGIIEMRTNEILQIQVQQPVNVAKDREKDRFYIDAPDVAAIDDNSKKRSSENDKRKSQPQPVTIDEADDKLQLVDEKGEDNDDIKMPIKDIQKKAQDFVKENYDKYITKKKPKAKLQNVK
eukprot:403368450